MTLDKGQSVKVVEGRVVSCVASDDDCVGIVAGRDGRFANLELVDGTNVTVRAAPDDVLEVFDEEPATVPCVRCGAEAVQGIAKWWHCKACGLSLKPEGEGEEVWVWEEGSDPRGGKWREVPKGLLYVASWEAEP